MPDFSPLGEAGFQWKMYVNHVHPFVRSAPVEGGITLFTPNCGKDIGGKMALIDCCFRMNDESEWMIFLHDKKSPQLISGEAWRAKLWKIVSAPFIKKAIPLLHNTNVGMIGPGECRMKWNPNEKGRLVDSLSEQYELPKTDFEFVAGTMFWMRSAIVRKFFSRFPPLQVRAGLEKGNVMDYEEISVTHAWERLFARMVVADGRTVNFI
jgi:lipopolysaccharide biosynthesis protein